MTTLPIPFVVAFLLVILAASNHQALKETPTGRLFALVLYLNAFGMVLVGVRWSWEVLFVLPVVATLSVISSALLYLAFLSLGRTGLILSLKRDWAHAVPPVLVLTSTLFGPDWIELWLIATKVVYCILFIRLAYQFPESMQLVRLSWLNNTRHALWAAAFLQLISIVVDIAIALDFAFYEGRHAASLVGFVCLMILVLLGYAAVFAGRGKGISQAHASHEVQNSASIQPSTEGSLELPHTNESIAESNIVQSTEQSIDPEPAADSDSAQLMHQLNKLLVEDGLYADTELNLQRFARKAGLPARTISRTVNANTGQNISQWVNRARINAVCRLLENKDKSISDAMFEAGFTTKSNFNREFRRIKGSSPSEWRESAEQNSAPTDKSTRG